MKIPLQLNLNEMNILGSTALSQLTAPPEYISPDALMSYCATRLRGIDDQVQTAFAKQERANGDSSVLGDLANDPSFIVPTDDKMNLDPGCTDNNSNQITSNQQATNAVAALRAAADKVSDPQVKAALQAAADKLQSAIDNKQTINGNDFKQMTADAVSHIQQSLNSGAELSMINLQSLMSQRQQAIQVCTNLVQSLGDQCNKIAENVGH